MRANYFKYLLLHNKIHRASAHATFLERMTTAKNVSPIIISIIKHTYIWKSEKFTTVQRTLLALTLLKSNARQHHFLAHLFVKWSFFTVFKSKPSNVQKKVYFNKKFNHFHMLMKKNMSVEKSHCDLACVYYSGKLHNFSVISLAFLTWFVEYTHSHIYIPTRAVW